MDPISLDPDDWDEFANTAHQMLDVAIAKMKAAGDGRVWTPFPEELKARFGGDLPKEGRGRQHVKANIEALLPYGAGNTHPRFFGWVHGSGTPGNLIAEMGAAAMNANLGGRDHGAMYVEKQVVQWCRQMFGFPKTASGLVVSGTSIATVIALKTARDRQLEFKSRKQGVQAGDLVGYASDQAHSCVARAFDILGLGSDALRKIPVDDAFQMDITALTNAVAADLAANKTPFCVIGTAGAVNVGSIDDLDAIADLAKTHGLWFHIDGAFGASGVLSKELQPKLKGLPRADSLAFDFHKWMHVNYDAGFVLIRDEEAHRLAFSERPEYLKGAETGLAAGNPWPTEYGPELSRGFRALKIWAQLAEHGTDKLGAAITRNCQQARYLRDLVTQEAEMEVLAPVAMNICCFRVVKPGLGEAQLDALNEKLVVDLQCGGWAAPSTTVVHGKKAIRVNITNHRTQQADLDFLVEKLRQLASSN